MWILFFVEVPSYFQGLPRNPTLSCACLLPNDLPWPPPRRGAALPPLPLCSAPLTHSTSSLWCLLLLNILLARRQRPGCSLARLCWICHCPSGSISQNLTCRDGRNFNDIKCSYVILNIIQSSHFKSFASIKSCYWYVSPFFYYCQPTRLLSCYQLRMAIYFDAL